MITELNQKDLVKPIWEVYTLSDPDSGDIKYVGSTGVGLPKRLATHCNTHLGNKEKNQRKYEWIMGLKRTNKKPIICILEECENLDEALNSETFWTYQFLAWGFSLFNIQMGLKKGRSTIDKMKAIGKTYDVSLLHKYAAEKRKKSVFQINEAGEVIAAYEFIIQASNELKIDRGAISKCCKGKSNSAGGFYWRYCDAGEYSQYVAQVLTQIKIVNPI